MDVSEASENDSATAVTEPNTAGPASEVEDGKPINTPSLFVIRPSKGWSWPNLRELWEYRELLYFFIWRDVKVRYKQTVLGAGWAILQPLFTMVIFSLFFGRLAGVPSDDVPYPIFSFAALVPWQLFASGLNQGANSVVKHQNLVKKVYFPRLTLPLAAVLAGLVDFALAFAVLLAMMAYFGFAPTIHVVLLPALLLLTIITSVGVSSWLAALNARYRDFQYIAPFLVQAWLFITPIAYPSSLLSDPWRTLYGINPMAGVVEGFRWALLGTETQPGSIILVSAIVSVLLLITGAIYFRSMERTLADVV